MLFLQNFNENGLLMLNSLSNNTLIAKIVYVFADAPIFFIPIFLISFWIYWSYKKNKEKKENLLFIFYGILVGITISIIIQHLIHTDRPELHLQNIGKLLLKHIPDASFPSDHATVSFSFFSGLIFAGYKKIAYIFLPFAIIMCLSRIIAGVHWPLDIIVGCLIGIFGAFISFKLLKKIKCVGKINNIIIKISSYFKL